MRLFHMSELATLLDGGDEFAQVILKSRAFVPLRMRLPLRARWFVLGGHNFLRIGLAAAVAYHPCRILYRSVREAPSGARLDHRIQHPPQSRERRATPRRAIACKSR